MHEFSLVRRLLAQVAEIAGANATNAPLQVQQICVEVGPLSAVEPLLMQSAFQQLAPHSAVPEASLVIQTIPLLVDCQTCGRQAQLAEVRFVCPACRANSLTVLAGDQVILKSITMIEHAAPLAPVEATS